MSKLQLVRDAIVTALRTIKTANGYATNLADSHVYPIFDQRVWGSKEDKYYPKAFVLLDDAEVNKLPSNYYENKVDFLIVVAIKLAVNVTETSVQMAITAFIDDMQQMVAVNDTLGGNVIDFYLTSYTTDSGATFPEGIAVFRCTAEYHERRV